MAQRRKGQENDLAALAARAERAKADGDPSGFLSGGLLYSDFAVVLGGCIEFQPEIPEFERKKIILNVAHNQALPRPITPESFLRECSKRERAYLALPKQRYRLLTEVSLWWPIEVPRMVVNGTTLIFKPKREMGFSSRLKLFQKSRGWLPFELPTNYMRVSATVSSRTPQEAAERALDALDLARASWNLALNRVKGWRHSTGRPIPVNDIRLSPFHTVHDLKGNLATETFWYDPGHFPDRGPIPFSDQVKFSRLLEFAVDLRSRLAQLPYRLEIERALIRYVRALDSADLNDAFLRLWSLLEYLTDSTHDPYKVATRRAAFLFADRERSQLVLSHLTNHRNRFIHAGSDTDDIEPLVFQLKRYVDNLLLFHLGSRLGFQSRSEAARFLDHPVDGHEIDLRIKRLRDAKKFISGGPSSRRTRR
jgi:hypothetical protein